MRDRLQVLTFEKSLQLQKVGRAKEERPRLAIKDAAGIEAEPERSLKSIEATASETSVKERDEERLRDRSAGRDALGSGASH